MHRLIALTLWGLFLATISPLPAAPQTANPALSVAELQRQYRQAVQENERLHNENERLRRELAAARQTIARLQPSQPQVPAEPVQPTQPTQPTQPAQPQTYQEAITALTKILEQAPQDALSYRKRGIAYAHIGKYPEALADLDRAIALNDADAEAYNQRGIVHYNLGRYRQAMSDFNRAIAKQPQMGEFYNNRGILHQRQGDYRQALRDLRQANQRGVSYASKAIEILRAKVRRAQQLLQRAGFDPGPADGLPGAATAAALRAYQQQQGLRVTGHLDNRTQQALGLSSSPAPNAASEHILSRFIDKPPLEYPVKARLRGWEGTVTLRFEMLSDGSIGTIEVAKSSGHAILDTAARDALKQWRHQPSSHQSETTWATLDFNFKLDNATDSNR
ncbi:TonB family protein [Candidatus Entotheonella palauensis]|uniref:TonB family protein n=1 Tax=Candidatus Entotheonella palauensis TaxID=93172 RepID=UPI000B7FD082|nr:TonB family protein [Candidatus Entotheonella palauensis]